MGAEYVALKQLFVGGRLIPAGALFKSDDTPGRNWKPANPEAERRASARASERAAIDAKVRRLNNEPTNPEAVIIPADWSEMRPEQAVNLARRLGCSSRCNYTQAVAWIEKTIAARTPAPKEQSNG